MARTPFEELSQTTSDEGQDYYVPSYMVAADTHAVGNKEDSIFEQASTVVDNARKFMEASLISGVNQLYNIPADIGNILGGDFERSSTEEVIKEFDNDLAKYYVENKEGIDTLGFIASSLVPGSAGIKGFKAFQGALETSLNAGKIGGFSGQALKLLVPSKEKYLQQAIQQITTGQSVHALTNANALRAIGAGLGQNVLEAAAFEIAVASTMFNSPVLENQDFGDLVTNIAFGAGLGGIIGGAISAAGVRGTLKRTLTESEREAFPWTGIAEAHSSSEVYEKIAIDFDQLHSMPEVPAVYAKERYDFLTTKAEAKANFLNQRIRKNIGELAGGDESVAETLYNTFKMATKESQLGATIGAKSVSALDDISEAEVEIIKLGEKLNKGKATAEEAARYSNLSVSYVRTYGEGMGKISPNAPTSISLADTLKKGEKIVVKNDTVHVGSEKYTFSIHKKFDITESSPLTTQARYVWAQNLPKFEIKKGTEIVIDQFDIPLLEKAYLEIPTEAKIRMADGTYKKFNSSNEFFDFLRVVKEETAQKLHDLTAAGAKKSDPQTVVAKLKSMLGIDFAVETPEQIAKYTKGSIEEAKLTRAYTHRINEGVSKIAVNAETLATSPLYKLVGSILHEEGHRKFDVLLDIGGIPKEVLATVRKELIAASKKIRAGDWKKAVPGTEYHDNYLMNLHELMADTFSYFSQYGERLATEAPEFNKLFGHMVRPLPKATVDSYMARATQLTQEDIARMVNVKSSYLTGTKHHDVTKDLFAWQAHAQEYTDQLIKAGSWNQSKGLVDIWNVPQHVKVVYDATPFKSLNNHAIENMQVIKSLQRVYVDGTNRAVANALGTESYNKLTEITANDIAQANSIGAGSGKISFANGNYGSLASKVEWIGKVTTQLIDSHKAATREVLTPLLHKLGQNQAAAIEWSTINANLRMIPTKYGINEAGTAFEPLEMLHWKAKVAEATSLGKKPPKQPQLSVPDAPLEIPINHRETLELARAHIELNAKRVDNLRAVRTAQGVQDTRSAEAFYPIPIDPKDFPFIAIVKDESITGTGHSKMLFAANEDALNSQINAVKADNPRLQVYTKKEAERYFDSVGRWEYEKTLHDNYMDVAAQRKGVSSPYLVKTDPQKIVDEALNWHLQRETGYVREIVSAKYEVPFNELARLGDVYTNLATSRVGNLSLVKYAEEVVDNPYNDYIKTALGISKHSDWPWWIATNKLADTAISKLFDKVHGVLASSKSVDDMTRINTMLQEAGYKGAAYDVNMDFLANHSAPKGVLSAVVQKANSVLATVVLRWDHMNAVVNAVSANVLLSAEARSVISSIERGDAAAVGKLAELAKINVPGTDKSILSPHKLIANAMAKFGKDTPEMAFYKDNGFVTSVTDQYKWSLDNLSFNGKESVHIWDNKIKEVHDKLVKLGETGEKWTGNRLAEEFNRFVAADVMKQLTDVAVEHGIMSPREALTYINTFVNRTQGNYLSSQRPLLFQGPIGQSIGLFQTYQFNLMQQLLRHVGEGQAKDAAFLLAMQGTIHGMNGLPGFNAINTHLIGNASGNVEHRDAFDVVYGAAGNNAADWIMYGAASNVLGLLHPDLKMNLYTRGDINPRHLTIVPTDPSQIPMIQATARFFGNLFETAGKISAGGDVATAFLQGLEHNGISRPLAGLAQTLEAFANPLGQSYSTSSKGNVIASNDLLTLANLGRLMGGKPFDEAITLDAAYRMQAYNLKDDKRRRALGEAIKTTLIAGNEPTEEQLLSFTEQYVATGGKQENFVKWVGQLYKEANTSQANKLARGLDTHESRSMQRIMGGLEVRDFSQ